MTGRPSAAHAAAVVILESADRFRAGYIAAVLAARAIAVTGPFADAEPVVAAIDAADRPGVVLVQLAQAADRLRLAGALRSRGIAFLTLRGTASRDWIRDEPSLPQPFAAYQVAEWAAAALCREGVAAELCHP